MKKIEKREIKESRVLLPGSKSISHRALICASLARGRSRITNLLESEDIRLTTNALRMMGATIRLLEDGVVEVKGFDGRPGPGEGEIFLGNSGTSMRLLAGIAALGDKPMVLTGDGRMQERPMKELLDALEMIGVTARSLKNNGNPPVEISGGNRKGGRMSLDCSRSSQYLSSMLMMGGFLDQGLEIVLPSPAVSAPYVDLTLDIMKTFGVGAKPITPTLYKVPGGQTFTACDVTVEPDLSNASYFWAAGALSGKMITVGHVSESSLQGDLGFIRILEKMGCRVEIKDKGIGVRGGDLVAVDVDMGDLPDVVPTLAVVAAFARGTTRISNIGHLREKECDRISVVSAQLRKMGIETKEGADRLEITGGKPGGAFIETFNDHRIAMAFSVAGLMADGITIEDETCVAKSFPNFYEVFDRL